MVPGAALSGLSGDPSDPMPGLGKAELLSSLTAEAADAYVALAGPDVETPLTALEIRHLGGALRSTAPDPGAAGPLEAEVLVYGVGVPVTPEVGAAVQTALDAVSQTLAPWVAARPSLLTFDERGLGLRRLFGSDVADRLARVTAAYDPDGRFVANQVAG